MVPASFRLDTLAATLVGRLEAVRRAHLDNPQTATEAIARATREVVAALAAECRDALGDEAQARRIEREGIETFLPRYTRLALAQNADEARLSTGGVFGQIAFRLAAAAVGFVVGAVLARIVPGPLDLLWYLAAPAALFGPELLTSIWRRRFAGQLQELTDDLGRVQEADDQLVAVPDPGAEPTRPRPPTREAN